MEVNFVIEEVQPRGGEKPAPKNKTITKEVIESLYNLPLTEAARALDICPTYLKRLCRKNGIKEWPYRRLSKKQGKARAIPGQTNASELLQADNTRSELDAASRHSYDSEDSESLVDDEDSHASRSRSSSLKSSPGTSPNDRSMSNPVLQQIQRSSKILKSSSMDIDSPPSSAVGSPNTGPFSFEKQRSGSLGDAMSPTAIHAGGSNQKILSASWTPRSLSFQYSQFEYNSSSVGPAPSSHQQHHHQQQYRIFHPYAPPSPTALSSSGGGQQFQFSPPHAPGAFSPLQLSSNNNNNNKAGTEDMMAHPQSDSNKGIAVVQNTRPRSHSLSLVSQQNIIPPPIRIIESPLMMAQRRQQDSVRQQRQSTTTTTEPQLTIAIPIIHDASGQSHDVSPYADGSQRLADTTTTTTTTTTHENETRRFARRYSKTSLEHILHPQVHDHDHDHDHDHGFSNPPIIPRTDLSPSPEFSPPERPSILETEMRELKLQHGIPQLPSMHRRASHDIHCQRIDISGTQLIEIIDTALGESSAFRCRKCHRQDRASRHAIFITNGTTGQLLWFNRVAARLKSSIFNVNNLDRALLIKLSESPSSSGGTTEDPRFPLVSSRALAEIDLQQQQQVIPIMVAHPDSPELVIENDDALFVQEIRVQGTTDSSSDSKPASSSCCKYMNLWFLCCAPAPTLQQTPLAPPPQPQPHKNNNLLPSSPTQYVVVSSPVSSPTILSPPTSSSER